MSKDIHSDLANKLYGKITKTGRAKAKQINYIRAYSGGEINVSKISGQYPTPDYTNLELRVLTFCT